MQTTGKEVSLYFHIPFCSRKCDYCHFYVLPDQEIPKQQLLEALQLEISFLKEHLADKKIITLYFGGGTPSLFGPSRIAILLNLLKTQFHVEDSAEITLEVNPENATLELMQAYADAGVNRISIGIQTLDPHLLALLGRLHCPNTAIAAINNAYQAGISNISIDLMYDLPKQTLTHWMSTLQQIQDLPLRHLSLYNLTIEPHTFFFKKRNELKNFLPDEETSLAMYESAIEKLELIGLKQYEISAFAKPSYESRHNIGYWTGRPFLGLGPSACSYWEGKRFRNEAHLGNYCKALNKGLSPIDFSEKLNGASHFRELFVIQLRLKTGVNLDSFTEKHGLIDPEMKKTLSHLESESYIYQKENTIYLTKKGILFYDTVASDLI